MKTAKITSRLGRDLGVTVEISRIGWCCAAQSLRVLKLQPIRELQSLPRREIILAAFYLLWVTVLLK